MNGAFTVASQSSQTVPTATPCFDYPLPGPLPRRARVLLASGVAAGAFGALALLVATWFVLVRLSWPHAENDGNPEFGVSFSCRHAWYLNAPRGTEAGPPAGWCASQLSAILEATGATHVRLSVEWSAVEPVEGTFEFDEVDSLLAEARRREALVLLTVGMKAQRHPEYYIPDWAMPSPRPAFGAVVTRDPELRQRALALIEATVTHFARESAVESWGIENEPYVISRRADGWTLDRAYIQTAVATVRANDPAGRPLVINQGQHFVFDTFEKRWRQSLEDGDVLGVDIYPFRNFRVLGLDFVVPIVELGPFAPNYAHQRRSAEAAGREYWITELQAEPWVDGDIRAVSPANPARNLTLESLERNLRYARRTGASRVYLWGAEWWLYQRDRYGDASWVEAARQAIAGGRRPNARGS